MSIIVGNGLKIEGNNITIKSNPTIGVLSLVGFTDNSTDGFNRRFRYSTNGVTFSQWLNLDSNADIQSVPVESDKDVIVIEVNYEKVNPLANVTAFTVTTQDDPVQLLNDCFSQSLFARFFTSIDQELINWYINVLTKLYNKGLIPNYISRQLEEDPSQFLEFWTSVTKFFSYYVRYAREFSKFYNNEVLVEAFLMQRGLNTSPHDIEGQRAKLLETFYSQMKQRGTYLIADSTGDNRGELRRLVHYKDVDEFFFYKFPKHHFGWNIGNCSPQFRSIGIDRNLIEQRVNWQQFANGEFINFQAGQTITFNTFKINSQIDYQFYYEILTSSAYDFTITGTNGFGQPAQFKSKSTGYPQAMPIKFAAPSRGDKWIPVKYILYNEDNGFPHPINAGHITLDRNVKEVTISITFHGTGQLRSLNFFPCPYMSRGFLDVANWITTYVVNRNYKYTQVGLHEYITRYMIPYNAHLHITAFRPIAEAVSGTSGDFNDDFNSDFNIG